MTVHVSQVHKLLNLIRGFALVGLLLIYVVLVVFGMHETVEWLAQFLHRLLAAASAGSGYINDEARCYAIVGPGIVEPRFC